MQATGSEDAAKEVVPEDVVTKDVAYKADAATAHNIYLLSET